MIRILTAVYSCAGKADLSDVGVQETFLKLFKVNGSTVVLLIVNHDTFFMGVSDEWKAEKLIYMK